MKIYNLLDFLLNHDLLKTSLEHIVKNSYFLYYALFFLCLSLLIKFRTRTVLLKDPAEWLMGLSLIFYPFIIKYIPGYKAMMSEPVRYFLMGGWILILTGFIALSFIYNRWNIFKASVSVLTKFLLTLFSYYLMFELYSYYRGGYFTGLTGYLKAGGIILLFFILLSLFLNGKRYLEGRFRLCNIYYWLERIFLWSSIVFSIFLMFKGHGIWTGLKVLSYGIVFFVFWRSLFKFSAASHIRAIIERLGEQPYEYKVKVFFTDTENAFAYETSQKKAIGVTDKFLKRFNLDELNFAIAHEIAHHRKSHNSVRFWTELLTRSGFQLFSSLGILTGWTGFLTAGVVQLFKKKFYKSEEHEADELAVQYLKEAGLTQQGAITFFEKICKIDSRRGFLKKVINLFLEDHPYPEKRLERIRGLVEF